MALQPRYRNLEEGAVIIDTRDRNGNALSSSPQQAAVASLRDVQPLEPDSYRRSRTNNLSVQQLKALATLKDFRNEDIIMLLEGCRQGIGSSYH